MQFDIIHFIKTFMFVIFLDIQTELQLLKCLLLKINFYHAQQTGSKHDKVGCVFPIVVKPVLPHAEFGPNDHLEDALHFISTTLTFTCLLEQCVSGT